ncbi:MAG: hypothetical protein FJX29_11035 [Alphaproteobacteria bacterium]|nr:hypothetical protein [Alphaproteobacteria bacterium]
MTSPLYDGFLPGLHAIDGYGAGGFAFGGMSHRGSLLALPSGVHAWDVTEASQITESSLAPLLREGAGSVECILFGMGKNLRPLAPAIRQRLNAAGMRCDVMATRHAISTYNIMLGERRLVAAALIATA